MSRRGSGGREPVDPADMGEGGTSKSICPSVRISTSNWSTITAPMRPAPITALPAVTLPANPLPALHLHKPLHRQGMIPLGPPEMRALADRAAMNSESLFE